MAALQFAYRDQRMLVDIEKKLFETVSEGKIYDYLEDILAEDLLDKLTKIFSIIKCSVGLSIFHLKNKREYPS